MTNQSMLGDKILLAKLEAIPHGRELLAIAKKIADGKSISRTDKEVLDIADLNALAPYFIEIKFSVAGMKQGNVLMLEPSGFDFTQEGTRVLMLGSDA